MATATNQTQTKTEPKTFPEDWRRLVEQANQGDETVLPELRRIYENEPAFAAAVGDLLGTAREMLLSALLGKCLGTREAVCQQMAHLREGLLTPTSSELERLLADRVALSWLELRQAEIEAANGDSSPATTANKAAQKRLDQAQARHLAVAKTLATVQKFLRPALSPLEMLRKDSQEGSAGPRMSRRSVVEEARAGVPVAN